MALQLTIDNAGILEAISDYVAKQGIDTTGKALGIDLKAGRGTNGFSATVDICAKGIDLGETPAIPEGPITRNTGEVSDTVNNSIFDDEG